ncbi:MAG TPA: hypothetical protein VHL85_09050 [Burkholderiales bacterium]|nr:hypothetical protein [Burkholderiales bacterium]
MFKRTVIAAAVLALPLAALAQTSTTSTSTTTTTSTSTSTSGTQAVPTNRMVTEYTKLAGSQDNAKSLVTGLRTGSQITLTDSSGKTTTFTPPTGKMGNGNVNITLRIAQQMMANNSNLTLQQALMGTSTTQGILQMRASGMGWGQIAKAEGFKLGDVMRSGKAETASSAGRGDTKLEKVARGERAEKVERAERPEKVERVERVERPQRPERPERAGR